MLFISSENITLQCVYEEPMYDEYPDVCSKISEHTITLPPLTGIELDLGGSVTWIDYDVSLGVSVHSGTLTVRTNLRDRIGAGIFPVSEDELRNIQQCLYELTNKQEEKGELLFQIDCLENCIKELCEEKYNPNIHLSQAEYEDAIKKIWDMAEEIIKKKFYLLQLDEELNTLIKACYRFRNRYKLPAC